MEDINSAFGCLGKIVQKYEDQFKDLKLHSVRYTADASKLFQNINEEM